MNRFLEHQFADTMWGHRCAPRSVNCRGTGRNPKEVRDMAHDSQPPPALHVMAVK